MSSFARKDSRIIVLNNDIPSDGAALARNLGLSKARGEFVLFLDSDDFFEENMLEILVEKALSLNLDMIMFDGYCYDNKTNRIYDEGIILRKKFLPRGDNVFSSSDICDTIFQCSIGAAWHMMFSKKFVDNNHIVFKSFHHADDLGFVYTALACAKRIYALDKKLVFYRVNNDCSQAKNISKSYDSCYLSLLDLKHELEKRDLFTKVKKSFISKSVEYINFYLSHIDNRDAFIKLYGDLRARYFHELELDDVDNDDFISNIYDKKLRREILKYTADEFLYMFYYRVCHSVNCDYIFSSSIKSKSNVILYGAGEYGIKVFKEISSTNVYDLKIVCWMDSFYEKKNSAFIKSPLELGKYCYDYILVTVIEKKARAAVVDFLEKQGVDKSKIVFIDLIERED